MPVTLKYEDGQETIRPTVAEYMLEGGLFGRAFRDRTESARILEIIGIAERYGDSFQVQEHSCDAIGKYRFAETTMRIDRMIKDGFVEALVSELESVKLGAVKLTRLIQTR